ncbi:MAG: NUDIX hydrolase [Anaerolineae bacterium]
MHSENYFDPAEEEVLSSRYGPTLRRDSLFALNEIAYDYWQMAISNRRAEVVLAVQRPGGELLFHRKESYPPGTYRLPSGGIGREETVLDALAREQWEELGQRLPPAAMPGLIHYRLCRDGTEIPFASYLFLLRPEGEVTPTVHDPNEAIAEFRWLGPAELPAVSGHLRGLVPAWRNWGRYRAIAHDLLAEFLGVHPAGPEILEMRL